MMENKIPVLYIDDEQANLSSFKFLFRKEFKTFLANSAEEGIEILKNNVDEINTVISDYKMPVINGVECLKQIMAIKKDTKRMILSGYIELNEAEMAIKEGIAHEYIKKPFRPDAVREAVKRGN